MGKKKSIYVMDVRTNLHGLESRDENQSSRLRRYSVTVFLIGRHSVAKFK